MTPVIRKNWLLALSGELDRAMPATPGQNNASAPALKSAVTIICASGWVTTGSEPTRPACPSGVIVTGTKPASRPRRNWNSPVRSGSSLPPAPVPSGSLVWAMKPVRTR